jgi:NAD(P)-dependent dehydrogenase (short-subunit alcohol dehydrogenase family)
MLTGSGVAVVTGASRGIGAAVARAAAAMGYDVLVNYRERADVAAAVVASIARTGRRAVACPADIAREDDIVRMFRTADELGRVTALVNNAGIMPRESRVADMDAGALASLWAVNITGAMLCSREAVRRMSTANGGRGGAVVNLSSHAGITGGRALRSHYAASKAALNGFTLGFAREVAREGIRVNAVCPGVTDTDMHLPWGGSERVARMGSAVPIGRAATPDDIGKIVAFLLSEDSAYLTGAVIDAAGGA